MQIHGNRVKPRSDISENNFNEKGRTFVFDVISFERRIYRFVPIFNRMHQISNWMILSIKRTMKRIFNDNPKTIPS